MAGRNAVYGTWVSGLLRTTAYQLIAKWNFLVLYVEHRSHFAQDVKLWLTAMAAYCINW